MLFSGLEEDINPALARATSEAVATEASIEIEVRFRTFTTAMNGGIDSEEAFIRSLKLFRLWIQDPVRSEEWFASPAVQDKVVFYEDGYRSIQAKNETRREFEQKKEAEGGRLSSKEWPMIVTFSTERKNIQLPSPTPVTLTGGERDRFRWSFSFKPKNKSGAEQIRVDFTTVNSIAEDKSEKNTFEIEIEAIGLFEEIRKEKEGYSYSALQNSMSEIGLELLKYIYDTPIPYNRTIRSSVISAINNTFDSKSTADSDIPTHFVNKPRPLEWSDLEWNNGQSLFPPEGSNEALYAVTIKTDGVRIMVFYHETGVYLFNPLAKTLARITSERIEKLQGCILDGELVSNGYIANQKELRVFVFDCLKSPVKTEETRDLPLVDRLKRARYIEKINNESLTIAPKIVLSVKSFFAFNDRDSFFVANRRAFGLNVQGGVELFKSDGLVFTDMGPYLRTQKTRKCFCNKKNKKKCAKCSSEANPSLNKKYKPVDLLTNDFLIVQEQGGDLVLHSEAGRGQTVPFHGTELYKIEPTRFQPVFQEDGKTIQLQPGKIYEFRWDKYESVWVPIRLRLDRLKPNGLETAQSNWNLIIDSIPPGVLLGKLKGKRVLDLMRTYHNRVKNETLAFWSDKIKSRLVLSGEVRRPRLFDIGSGAGGDVAKWKFNGYDVIALEPSGERLDELEARAGKHGILNRIQTMQMKIQDSTKILSKFANLSGTLQQVDIVTSFHSMTLIYESLESIMAFVQTLKGVLKVGGIFVCMAMDGAAIHKYLGDNNQLSMEGIKIQRSKDNVRKIMVKMVTYDSSLARGQTEFLVDFDHLISVLEGEGFELVNDSHLDTARLLSDSELWWSQMTRIIEMRYVGAKDLPHITKQLDMLANILAGTMASPQVEVDQIIEVDEKGTRSFSEEGQKFWLVGVLAGGSSFFHALLWAIDKTYRHSRGKVNLRFERVVRLRLELATKLRTIDIPGGVLQREGSYSFETIRETMAEYTMWCGEFMIPFIEEQLNVNIHVVSWLDGVLVPIRTLKDTFVASRDNVLLHRHENGRFEPLGRSLAGQSEFASFVFSAGDELVRKLQTFYH